MHLYEEDNPKDRLYGILAACAAYMLIAFLIMIITVRANQSDRSEQLLAGGVMMDFGDDVSGFGKEALPEVESQPTKSVESNQEEKSSVTESELAVNESDSTRSEPKKQEEPTKKQEQQVNTAALFPGKGSDEGKGDDRTATGTSGSLDGSEGGSGSGGTTSGIGNASLAGRSLMGSLPSPSYDVNSSGRVVVEVRVNQMGVVESAVFKAQGSTTTNSSLVRSAIDAAKRARFNSNDDAPITQIGTITYNFKLE